MISLKNIFIAILCLIFVPDLIGQELEGVKKNITGTWELDLQSTKMVFDTLKDQLPDYRQKEIAQFMDYFSGAEIKAVCTEAGYFAIREERGSVTHDDFLGAIEKVRFEEDDDSEVFFG